MQRPPVPLGNILVLHITDILASPTIPITLEVFPHPGGAIDVHQRFTGVKYGRPSRSRAGWEGSWRPRFLDTRTDEKVSPIFNRVFNDRGFLLGMTVLYR